jgi:FkbM family methyltransferase
VLFDVGSNNGAWTAAYLTTHPDAAAFLLEPNPRFEEELHLIETRYDAVHVRAAAWIADGNATFHFSRNDESSSLIAGMIRCNARSCATPCSILCDALR